MIRPENEEWHGVWFPGSISFISNLFIFPTTRREIEVEISNLRTNKAVGPSSIPIDILKIIKCVVSKPLEILFNASFSTGIVPYDLKLANVVPVYKKGSQTSRSNYRPISLLSIFNKKACKSYFFVIVAFVELFTVMIWLNVHQERNWEFMMTIRCYIGNGKMAKW